MYIVDYGARLLDHAVRGTTPSWDSASTQMQCNLCNDKRLAAKRAGEQSAELFLGLFVAECGPISQVRVENILVIPFLSKIFV